MNRRLLLALFALTACAGPNTNYQSLVQSWIGASATELRHAWGEPSRSRDDGVRTVVVYEARRAVHVPGTAGVPLGPGGSTLPGSAAMDLTLFCATTFELEAAVVVASSFVGNGCSSVSAEHARRGVSRQE